MTSSGTLRSHWRGGTGIAVAMAVMNVSTYAYTIVAARLLGPESYGGFAAVMNLLLVISVLALALQATAARRISADGGHARHIQRGVVRVGWYAALVAGGCLLLLSPVVDRMLRLDHFGTALLVAATTVPLTVMGAQAGVLQGERRWRALAAVYLAAGLPRIAIGASLLVWRPEEFYAVLGVAIAALAPVGVGWLALRRTRAAGAEVAPHRSRAILAESLANSQALLAFFALSNLDIVVARNVLSGHDSGLYAAGLILTKAMLFLPQFVVVVAFPSMATVHRRGAALSRGVAVIAGFGLAGSLAAWLLPDLALVFIGGDQFAALTGRLWLFALLGTVLATLQLLVYSVLARRGRRSSLLLWGALVVMLVAGSLAGSLVDLVLRVLVVDAALLVVLLGLSAWLLPRDRQAA